MSSPTGRRRRFLVADIEAALRATAGIYSAAAAILAQKYGTCSPNTVKNYISRHARLKEVEDDIAQQTLDLAETKLVQAIGDGNMTAVIFYLKTKGRQRGYIERREIEGAEDGKPIRVKPDLSGLSDGDLRKLRALCDQTAESRPPAPR